MITIHINSIAVGQGSDAGFVHPFATQFDFDNVEQYQAFQKYMADSLLALGAAVNTPSQGQGKQPVPPKP